MLTSSKSIGSLLVALLLAVIPSRASNAIKQEEKEDKTTIDPIRQLTQELELLNSGLIKLKSEKLILSKNPDYQTILKKLKKYSGELKELEEKLVGLKNSITALLCNDPFEQLCKEYLQILPVEKQQQPEFGCKVERGPIQISYLQRVRLAQNYTRLQQIQERVEQEVLEKIEDAARHNEKYKKMQQEIEVLSEKIRHLEAKKRVVKRKIQIERQIQRQIAKSKFKPKEGEDLKGHFLPIREFNISDDEGETNNLNSSQDCESEYQEALAAEALELTSRFVVIIDTGKPERTQLPF